MELIDVCVLLEIGLMNIGLSQRVIFSH